MRLRFIIADKEQFSNKAIEFRDMKEYLSLFEELNIKNIELELSNEKLLLLNEELKKYTTVVKELAISKERIRFARDIHDTLGQTLVLLISLLETGMIHIKNEPSKTKELLSQALVYAREGLHDLRRSLDVLKAQKLTYNNLKEALQELVEAFNATGMTVKLFIIDQGKYSENEICSEVVYRICQEALSNSLRHGRAENVSLVLQFEHEKLQLHIVDDGVGCENIEKGAGLTGMEQRLRDLKGSIRFQSNPGQGFSIMVETPTLNG